MIQPPSSYEHFHFTYRLAGAQAELDEVMSVLKEKQDKLAAVEAKVQFSLLFL